MFATSHNRSHRMPGQALPVLVLAALCLAVAVSPAGAKTNPIDVARGSVVVNPPADDHAAGAGSDCRACHTQASPTPGHAALRECGRNSEEVIAQEFSHMSGPRGKIVLDVLSSARDIENHRDRFGPVTFDHGAHAQWAKLSVGCAVCHHYTPEGAAHPACRTCHEAGDMHEDMHKPGLKGAYHRQCLGCHREWSHETKCGVCHEPRPEGAATASAEHASKDDIIGVEHPPIPEPDEHFYQTRFGEDEGSVVLFAHKRHTQQYDLRCVDCHLGDGCVRCHESGNRAAAAALASKEPHETCSGCHDTDDDCSSCHREPGQEMPKAFNHASTGFSLAPHHRKLSCRTCHDSVPYQARSGECSGCHRDWGNGKVDHSVLAGLKLDEIHSDIDCETCHMDNKFAAPPSCEACHEDRQYPGDLPGERVTKETARAVSGSSRKDKGSGGK